MENVYADIIINISHQDLDRPFQYIVPEEFHDRIAEGMEVTVPFGKGDTRRKGYVINITDKPAWPEDRLKSIIALNEKAVGLEAKTLELAAWMRKRYGSTMIVAMQTVLPVRKKIKATNYKTIRLLVDNNELSELVSKCNSYKAAGRKKLLEHLKDVESVPYSLVRDKLGVSDSVIKTLEKNGVIAIEATREYRKPKVYNGYQKKDIILSDEQLMAVSEIKQHMDSGSSHTDLIFGVTGSGKTEVYMELIEHAIRKGQQAIVLIPEIALSFQTLMRFYARFGDRVSVIHSKLSDGEKFDQYEQAKDGKLDIMIGPRSALFTPFPNTGIIIIDEEHELSYKSEKMPKYHARDVAKHIAEREGAQLVLGSATPSMESFYKARSGEYGLIKLTGRNGNAVLPQVDTVDMRQELKNGNKTYFSRLLREKLTECLADGKQAMLFINRRGYAGFISCRECGYVMKCPHCDVALSHHKSYGRESMECHYCGYSEPVRKICPSCGSKYFSGFKVGTERIEEELKKAYPSISVLRMDADTTKSKDDYDRILSDFAERKADVLVGTQMIVKGHDFPYVTLVGIVAADTSLYSQDYRAQERTFQLLTQAAGRAGRGLYKGSVVIQTYKPDEYSLKHAMHQDFESFYAEEILYRSLSGYPPVSHMLALQFYGPVDEQVKEAADKVAALVKKSEHAGEVMLMGPARAIISKMRDIYRYVIYIKASDDNNLIEIKDLIEDNWQDIKDNNQLIIQFDLDPAQSF